MGLSLQGLSQSGAGAVERAVGEALQKCVPAAARTGAGRWGFSLANGRPHRFDARLADGWLLLDAAAGAHGRTDAWELLRLNARLGGSAKLARTASGETRLRAELPAAHDEIDLVPLLAETCAGLRAALGALHGEAESHDSGPELEGRVGDDPVARLRELCEEAGWTASARAGGELAVELEVPGEFRQATLREETRGRLSATVEVLAPTELSAVSSEAVGALLLEAAGLVRLVRPAAIETEDAGGARAARFEVVLPASAAGVGRALSALSVACAEFGREATGLASREVALRYLAARARR